MHRLFPPFLGGSAALGLLLVRIATGLALMMHGWPKIQNPTGWMPGGAYPSYALAAAAIAEFVGGACLIVGLLTPLSAAAAAGTMCVAVSYHVNNGDPFVGKGASYELAVVYLATCLLLVLAGPGKLSIDASLFGKRKTAT